MLDPAGSCCEPRRISTTPGTRCRREADAADGYSSHLLPDVWLPVSLAELQRGQETLARALFDALATLDHVRYVRIRTAKPDAYADCDYIAYQLAGASQP